MKVKIAIIATAICMASTLSSAQERPPFPSERTGGMSGRPVMLTAEERAVKRTEEMDKTVCLDGKQYKKIYKIFRKEEKAKDSAMQNGAPMGPPPAHMGAGRPPQGFPGGGPGMPSPGDFNISQGPAVGGKKIDSDEYIDAREDKFRKILTAEQYSTWRRHHPDPFGFFDK